MTPDLILARYRACLAAGTFTLADMQRETGIALSNLQTLRDGEGAERFVKRLKVVGKALAKLDPKVAAHLASPATVQLDMDTTRPVHEQIKDVERDLERFGVKLPAVLAHANINPRTWQRWRAGDGEPGFSRWVNALGAAQQMIELAAIDASHTRSPVSTGIA